MRYDKRHYYYDIEQDKFIGCSFDKYRKVSPKFMLDNFDKVKQDEFILADGWDVPIEEVCNIYVISTVCLPKHQDLIYVTVISSSLNDYNGYQKRYTSLEEAKEGHDKIVLKIIRGEDL